MKRLKGNEHFFEKYKKEIERHERLWPGSYYFVDIERDAIYKAFNGYKRKNIKKFKYELERKDIKKFIDEVENFCNLYKWMERPSASIIRKDVTDPLIKKIEGTKESILKITKPPEKRKGPIVNNLAYQLDRLSAITTKPNNLMSFSDQLSKAYQTQEKIYNVARQTVVNLEHLAELLDDSLIVGKRKQPDADADGFTSVIWNLYETYIDKPTTTPKKPFDRIINILFAAIGKKGINGENQKDVSKHLLAARKTNLK